MGHLSFATIFLFLQIVGAAYADPVTIKCNETLSPNSVLKLDSKLDLTGRTPGSVESPYTCSIIGPDSSDAPATIVLPDTDCALTANLDVILSGNLKFLVGKKTEDFDCCTDGEGHGSILCSYDGNITITHDAVITVETTDDDVVVGPGAFYAARHIDVHGTVNVTLRGEGRMTGVDGVITASGVTVSKTGKVYVAGQNVYRGSAISGGDTIIDGRIECSSYSTGEAGCVSAGNTFALGEDAVIKAKNGYSSNAGGVLIINTLLTEDSFKGKIIAENITCDDAGAVVTATGPLVLSGNAQIHAKYVNSSSSGAVIACGNLTLKDNSQIVANYSWGGFGGAIAAQTVFLQDEASYICENAYAASCGACALSSLELTDKASMIGRATSSGIYGGFVCGFYPGQYLKVTGEASIDVDGSVAAIYGGAFFMKNISLGLDGGAFSVNLRNTKADCAAAIMTLDENNIISLGPLAIDGSGGGKLVIEDPKEGESYCMNIEAYFPGPIGQPDQPCSHCATADYSAKEQAQCMCDEQKTSDTIRECCTSPSSHIGISVNDSKAIYNKRSLKPIYVSTP